MKAKYELKVRRVHGGAWGDQREVTILNRRLRWRWDHARGRSGARPEARGGVAHGLQRAGEARGQGGGGGRGRLSLERGGRALAACEDRADVQCAAKEACRHMAAPTRATWEKLKRLVRFLLRFPRHSWTFKRDECETDTIDVFSDSSPSGNRR